MPNVLDKIRADGLPTGIFLKTWGEDVTRYPLGDLANPQTVKAIVSINEEAILKSIAEETIIEERIDNTGTIEVTELQATDDRDLWGFPNRPLLNDLIFRSDNAGRTSDPGLKPIKVKIDDPRKSRRFAGRRD